MLTFAAPLPLSRALPGHAHVAAKPLGGGGPAASRPRTALAMNKRPEAVLLQQQAASRWQDSGAAGVAEAGIVCGHAGEANGADGANAHRGHAAPNTARVLARKYLALAVCIGAIVSSQAWAIYSVLGLMAGFVLAQLPLIATGGEKDSSLVKTAGAAQGATDVENLRRRIASLEQSVYLEQAALKAAETEGDSRARSAAGHLPDSALSTQVRAQGGESGAGSDTEPALACTHPEMLEFVAQGKSLSPEQIQHIARMSADQQLEADVVEGSPKARYQPPQNDYARWQDADARKRRDHPHYSGRMRERILFLWGQQGFTWFGLREDQAGPELDLLRNSEGFLERNKRFLDKTYQNSGDDGDPVLL